MFLWKIIYMYSEHLCWSLWDAEWTPTIVQRERNVIQSQSRSIPMVYKCVVDYTDSHLWAMAEGKCATLAKWLLVIFNIVFCVSACLILKLIYHHVCKTACNSWYSTSFILTLSIFQQNFNDFHFSLLELVSLFLEHMPTFSSETTSISLVMWTSTLLL